MRLVWTLSAREDRKAIREYIALDNSGAALALDELLTAKTTYLTAHVGMGRPGRMARTRELVVHPNYIVVYDIAGDLVRILRVMHAAQQWPPAIPTSLGIKP